MSLCYYLNFEMEAKKRIQEIDWLRCICILLVVSFHIVLIENKYEHIYQFIGIFHVPVFLIISGYLANTDKPRNEILQYLARLGIPYLVMETAYIMCASEMNVSDHVDNLNLYNYIYILLVKPLGIYWYLHTIILCFGALSISSRVKLSPCGRLIIFFFICIILNMVNMISITNVFYYLIGVIINKSKREIKFSPKEGLLALIPILFIAFRGQTILCSQILFFLVTMLFISSMIGLYSITNSKIKNIASYIGRNTFPNLLFSPIFTYLSKYYQHFLISIDSSCIIFLMVTLFLACLGSIAIQKVVAHIISQTIAQAHL